jgi:hypothetical protein
VAPSQFSRALHRLYVEIQHRSIMRACKKCGKTVPLKCFIDGKKKSLQSRKNCLDCVPYGSAPVWGQGREPPKPKYSLFIDAPCKLCSKKIKRHPSKKALGDKCSSCWTTIRRIRQKLKAIEYLGGKCNECGYSQPWALEFHHRKPEQKDFSIGEVGNKSWKVIQPELDKCTLVCANCHRLIHASTRGKQKFMDEALKTR